ncbi:MAG: ATP-binding protein [Cyclobacteriaceae bacterium]|nr:ATP-binding protein [Cyclobacteriaceae bacterium]
MSEILIVEDEALIALSLKERLERFGYKVSGIIDRGEDIQSTIETNSPDLILMDINLKGKRDGIETATYIKKTWNIPIVFLTSYTNKSILDRAKQAEPYGYIVKTIDDNNLHITIDVALNKHQANMAYFNKTNKELNDKNKHLKKANYDIEQLTYNLSHAVKGPLASIHGLINLLATEKPTSGYEPFLKMMQTTVNRLEGYIHDIVTFAENNNDIISQDKIFFDQLIPDIIESLQLIEGWKRIDFKFENNFDGPLISDKRRITIILQNLLMNAVQYHNYSSSFQYIVVNVSTVLGRPTITVQDNGLGIDKEMQPQIFNMFFRGSIKSEGSGLGLYIVKTAVEKLNGKIYMNSDPGIGTSFTITL